MAKKFRTVSVILVGVLIFLSLLGTMGTSCKSAEDKAVEKTIQELIKAESGGEVDAKIDSKDGSITIESSGGKMEAVTGSKAQWPSEVPKFVPQMDGDLISMQVISHKDAGQTTGKNYGAMYDNIKDNKDSYEKKLESNGWNIMMSLDHGDGWMIQAEHDEGWGMTASGVDSEEDSKAGVLSFFYE